MKGIIYHIVFIIGLLMPFVAQSQSVLKPEYAHLWTDRAVYITGEDVKFSGVVGGKSIVSQVAYIELITPYGEKVSQSKLHIKEGLFSGELSIPSEILSGYYYLRAYTKWMRNGSPLNYDYVLLRIINPYTKEVFPLPDSLINNDIISVNKSVILKDSISSINHYEPNETVLIELINDENEISNISVIPELAKPYDIQSLIEKETNYSQLLFYPETRGITLSGILKSKATGKALSFHQVNIHILGEKDFMSVLSDSRGHFYFALPERIGPKELFIIAASIDNDIAIIEIDQDFCYQPIALKVPKFTIEENEKASVLKMVQNQQVFEAFQLIDTVKSKGINFDVFYGEANKTIDISYYVALDSLEQYFTDIPSWVLVKKRKGKRYFQVIGEQGELKLYEPLVLVDWVPVDDADRILAIHPAVVDKIDIITQSYIHGDIIYGGIINILTKNGDFGGLKFPESGMYLNFDFYSKAPSKKQKVSKFTNTYYWMPNFSQYYLDEKASFIAPRQQGEYIILYQGIDKFGARFSSQKRFGIDAP